MQLAPLTLCPIIMSFSGKNSPKNFFLRFSWKVLPNLIWIWRIQKSSSFFQIFCSSSLFYPSISKNFVKNGSKHFFSDFHENCNITFFDMENSKTELIFPYFFIFISIFASISQKCSTKWFNIFFTKSFVKITI